MNNWKVIWWDKGKKFVRTFTGDKPSESGAIDFGKHLQSLGLIPYVVSGKKAFAPPFTKRIPPEEGMIWCPYCLKWRTFVEKAIRHGDLVGPALWRCPICTISVKDAYVRRFNMMMMIRLEGTKVKVPSEKLVRNKLRKERYGV